MWWKRWLTPETAPGAVLLLAAAAAMILANSPLADAVEGFWTTGVPLALGDFSFVRDVRFWVNDLLMAIFFFAVGLELRHEAHSGALSTLRGAAFPAAAALGGMLLPAALFVAFTAGTPGAAGWGVPMATDIAFALGVLTLLGARATPGLRVFLLALAVVDDLGAILVIALFYSHGISALGLGIMATGVVLTLVLQRLKLDHPMAYLIPGVLVWAGCYGAGLHPTLAGVLLGLLTPVTAMSLGREAPSARLLSSLHGWVAFAIMPIFALANAGVPLANVSFEGDALRVFLGVVVGLVVGKPLGVVLFTRALERAGLVTPAAGVTPSGVRVAGALAGIGFTMALFIASLAFEPGVLRESAKVAILVGSVAAALVGVALASFGPKSPRYEASAEMG